MTRPQVREGFRRIGVFLGWGAALLDAIVVIILTRPGTPAGSWWLATKWLSLTLPVAYWFGSAVSRICGWVVAGFFPPGPDLEPKNLVEIAKAELRGKQPSVDIVEDIVDFIRPYAVYGIWLMSWLATNFVNNPITRVLLLVLTFIVLYIVGFVLHMVLGELVIRLLETLIPALRPADETLIGRK